MEKCWFVLHQTHYPPPDTTNGTGPLQLGHLIPNLKSLDQVINRQNGPCPFPRGMVSYQNVKEKFTWHHTHKREIDTNLGVNIPIPQAAGLVSAGGQAGVFFKRSVKNYTEFERMETEFIQPAISYIEDSIEDLEVQEYLKKSQSLKRWSLFMISGLAIARGAKGGRTDGEGSGVHGGPSV
ncbi:hypothetical protein ABW20_dc0104808 [Dactylellina cionopaga]|nr:hypothetical protein ABW20_dc0104808 [Dactylellina cionopaga]